MINIELKRINTSLRPHRVATLVFEAADWREKCLKVIESYSQIWGGAYNLIIPTNGKKIDEKFWFLLKKFDPDYIATYSSQGETHNLISKKLKKELFTRLNTFLNYDGNEIDIINLSSNESRSYPLTSISTILPRVNLDTKTIYNYDINYSGYKYMKDTLELLYSSFLGNINHEYSNNLKNIDFGEFTLDWENLDHLLGSIFCDKTSQPYIYSPFSYSMINLEKYYSTKDYLKMKKSSVLLVVGDRFEDFALYYNLSRLRYNVVWIPNMKILGLKEFITENGVINVSFKLKYIFEIMLKFNELLEENIIITSFSLSCIELDMIKGKLSRIVEELVPRYFPVFNNSEVSKNIENILTYILRVYGYDNEDNSYIEQFFDSKAVNPIKTPIPRNFNHRTFIGHYWITDVAIEDYKLPNVHYLNDIISAKLYSDEHIRISKEGISYFCPHHSHIGDRSIDNYLVTPEINLIDPFEIFRRIFENIGFIIEYSDDGLFEKESTDKFGSIDKIAEILRDKSCISLLDWFIEEKNPNNPDDGIMLKDNRIYISLDRMRELLSGMNEIDAFLEDLINRNVIQRGFIFKCKRCLNADWYHPKEITAQYACKRCGKPQKYNIENLFRQKDDFEPQWFYKLDEVFCLGYKKNMEVPILTLNKLKNESKDSFLYVNQIKLKKISEPDKDFMEIDICCISDGKIMIGECKKPKKLHSNTIKKYYDISTKIGAIGVFSTFEPNGFSNDVKENIAKLFGEDNYQIFDGDELMN